MTSEEFNLFFFENIRFGLEVYLRCRNRKYFVEGWLDGETGKHDFFVYDFTDGVPPGEDLIWSISSDDMEENARAFLKAKIFFGKSFLELQDEMEWVDC